MEDPIPKWWFYVPQIAHVTVANSSLTVVWNLCWNTIKNREWLWKFAVLLSTFTSYIFHCNLSRLLIVSSLAVSLSLALLQTIITTTLTKTDYAKPTAVHTKRNPSSTVHLFSRGQQPQPWLAPPRWQSHSNDAAIVHRRSVFPVIVPKRMFRRSRKNTTRSCHITQPQPANVASSRRSEWVM